jgi:hypothetical protein
MLTRPAIAAEIIPGAPGQLCPPPTTTNKTTSAPPEHSLDLSRKARDIIDLIFLIQNHEKYYFIKYLCFGTIQKPHIAEPRDNRAQTVPQTRVKT